MLRSLARCFTYKLPGEILSSQPATEVKGFIAASEVYKPASVIEFDSKGETLVYSTDSQKHFTVFFPMPWSIGTWSIPILVWQIIQGNLALSLPLAIGMYAAILPHCLYLYNLRFQIDKIWYVRGGLWKIKNSGIHGLESTATTGSNNLTFIKGDTDLNEEGKLNDDLVIVAKDWLEYYERIENQEVKIMRNGNVHNPELFQAMLKKLKIDDSNFVVNKHPEDSLVSQKCIGK